MEHELSPEGIGALLNGVTIPPRPSLLLSLDAELKSDSPNPKVVDALITKDVGVSAAMLRTLNSPLFGLSRKVGSVLQAVQLLGMRNVRNVVTGLMLRNAAGGGASLERFWDSAEKVASINAHICSLLPRVPREECYTFGLFRDSGIPMLMQRFPDYRETLRIAAVDPRPMTKVEEERHGTSHAAVGHVIGRVWGLSDTVRAAILHHHGKALAAHTHAARRQVQFQAKRLGEGGRAIGQHHHILAHALILAPGTHDEGVIGRHADNRIHTLGAERRGVLHEAGQVLGRAGGREGAGHAEDHHGLAAKQRLGGDFLRPLRRALHEAHAGNAVADLNAHGNLLWVVGGM
jgi:HD-like signal output (HDOD) protein